MTTQRSGRGRHPHGLSRARSLSEQIARAPETVKFLRRAAPAFFREISNDYSRTTTPAPLQPNISLWSPSGLHAAWLGHSTVLIQVDGFTILTDPVFSTRVGISLGPLTVGIKRLVDPALSLADLPPIDLILLSHAHMDHFDIPSLRELESPRTHVVTAYRTADLLRPKRYASTHELSWGESAQTGEARVAAFEVAHWGARMRSDVYRGFNGYLIEIGSRRIVFGGDTAYTSSFRQLKKSQPVDLAIMPIGAYDPWIRVHCNPEQALQMADDAGAEIVLPVHHQTFHLGHEPRLEPIERLLEAAKAHTGRVCIQQIGGEFHPG